MGLRILMVVDFREGHPRALWNNPRMLRKGFIRNGHDVMEFSVERQAINHTGIWGKWAGKMAKEKAEKSLEEFTKHYQPDLVILSFRGVDRQTAARIRNASPKAILMLRYGDMCQGLDPEVLNVGTHCDWMIATSAGDTLKKYKEAGIPRCAFIPNPCDPDLQFWQEPPDSWKSDILFTGKIAHRLEGQDPEREKLIQDLHEQRGITVWGCLGKPRLEGRDYWQAICGTKIALSINAFNNVRMYHSDRLAHYLACGAFVLAKSVPDSEQMFVDGEHLRYFQSSPQCEELLDQYLSDSHQRQRIASRGRQRMLDEFSCEKIAGYIVDLLEQGNIKKKWSEIVV